jgi:hypothetical protein
MLGINVDSLKIPKITTIPNNRKITKKVLKILKFLKNPECPKNPKIPLIPGIPIKTLKFPCKMLPNPKNHEIHIVPINDVSGQLINA